MQKPQAMRGGLVHRSEFLKASRPELFVACWGGVAADTHHHPSFPGVGALGLALHGSERGSFSLWTCDFHADFA